MAVVKDMRVVALFFQASADKRLLVPCPGGAMHVAVLGDKDPDTGFVEVTTIGELWPSEQHTVSLMQVTPEGLMPLDEVQACN